MDQEQPAVPDLETPDGRGARWMPGMGVLLLNEQKLAHWVLSPDSVRKIYAWVEEHHLA